MFRVFLHLIRTFLYMNQRYSWMRVAWISYIFFFPEGLQMGDLPHGVVKMPRVGSEILSRHPAQIQAR